MIRRLFPPSVLVMTAVWLFLWGDFAPFGLLSGMVIAHLVRWRFPLPPIHWPGRFRPRGMAALVGHLLHDLVVSSWRVLRLAVAPKVRLRPGIVRIDLVTDVDLYQVQVAEMISLVPGTVVVELVRSPRSLYLHVVDMDEQHDKEAIRDMAVRIERQVLDAFGSDEERAAFAARHGRAAGNRSRAGGDGWESQS